MYSLGISFEVINELETIGVIKFDSTGGYIEQSIECEKSLFYIDGTTSEIIEFQNGYLPIGDVLLTDAGKALKNIITPDVISEYEHIIKNYMHSHGVVFRDKQNYQIHINLSYLLVYLQ